MAIIPHSSVEVTVDDMKLWTVTFSSSVIHTAWYSPEYNALVIRFHTGSVWLYRDVWIETFHEFATAPSAGTYFNMYIRNFHSSEKYLTPDAAKQFFDDEK